MTGLPVGLSLPSKKNHLTFDFAGISLAYPDRVRYQYILDGYDPEWSPITSTSRITYSNIPPGEYSFKVISRNSSGIWNQEPVSFDFEIRAPLWQNRFFLVGLALFIALSVFGFIKFRENSFVKEQARLELMVDERTHELSRAKKRSEDLLLNILPVETARELRDHGKARAREYRECSVLFSDFKGFTSFSSKMNGEELVAELDSIFRTFDAITDKYDVEKIKTIGDAYMCASGLPEENRFHALNTVLMGLEMIHALDRMNQKRIAENRQVWQVRVGIHTGPLVAGVVGEKKFAYDIWGDTVNTASRMEHYSEPGRLNISGVTLSHVMDYVETSVRGPLYVKGKGELMMYFVERIRPEFSADEEGMVPNKRLMSMLRSESAYIGV
jgi:class 3 adenylate cyclase